MELRLAHLTFVDDIAVYVSVRFVGRNNPNGWRGFYLVGGPARDACRVVGRQSSPKSKLTKGRVSRRSWSDTENILNIKRP
jgi:hypothetical protein